LKPQNILYIPVNLCGLNIWWIVKLERLNKTVNKVMQYLISQIISSCWQLVEFTEPWPYCYI